MVRTEGRLRPLWNALACAALACALAACGGGGGGGGSSPTPPDGGNGGSTPESAYLLAEFTAVDSNHQYVRVWDPAHPAAAIRNVQILQGNGIVWTYSHLSFSDATQYDAATRTVTTLGHAKVFYDNDGKLYSIDLRGGQSHAPVQLSAAVDVFTTIKAFPMNAAGDDAWVDVQGGAHDWAIRSTMSATDAPVAMLHVHAALRDAATGLPQYFFCTLGGQSGTRVDPTTYQVFDEGFAPVAVAAVAGMNGYDSWVGADPVKPGLGYVSIAGDLRELHWSAAGVSVDAEVLHTFAFSFGGVPAAADPQSLYFADSTALFALADGALSAVGSFSVAPSTLIDAGAYLAAQEQTVSIVSTPRYQVESLGKASGVATLIEPAGEGVQLLGANDQWLILTGTAGHGPAFMLADGAGTERRAVGSQYVGLVRAASARLDQPAAPTATLSCVASSTAGFCAAGALTQEETDGGAATLLGSLASTATWMRGDATVGVEAALPGYTFLATPAGFGSGEVDQRDAWQLLPKSGSSLTRVTSNVP